MKDVVARNSCLFELGHDDVVVAGHDELATGRAAAAAATTASLCCGARAGVRRRDCVHVWDLLDGGHGATLLFIYHPDAAAIGATDQVVALACGGKEELTAVA